MNSLTFNNGQSLAIEFEGKRIRIVVYKNGMEEVCRKEYLSNLLRFIDGEEQRIFKGRLQLIKTAEGIGVEVKNELAGNIGTNDFLDFLKNTTLQQSSQS